MLNGIKVEDLIQQFGAAVSDHCSSSENNIYSGTQTPIENVGNNENAFHSTNSNCNGASLSSQDLLNQQLLLLLNNSHLLPNLSGLGNSGNSVNMNGEDEEVHEPDGPESAHEPPQHPSPAATSSSSSDFGGIKKLDISEKFVTPATGAAKRKKRKIEVSPPEILGNGYSDGFSNDTSRFTAEMVKVSVQSMFGVPIRHVGISYSRFSRRRNSDISVGKHFFNPTKFSSRFSAPAFFFIPKDSTFWRVTPSRAPGFQKFSTDHSTGHRAFENIEPCTTPSTDWCTPVHCGSKH